MASHALTFAELVEIIDKLPLEQREGLVEVVRHRNLEEERDRLVASVRSANREHRRGKTKPISPDDLMLEITG